MKAFAISTFLFLLAAKLNAAPANNPREPEVTLTFEGAADASYTLIEPADGSIFYIGIQPAPFSDSTLLATTNDALSRLLRTFLLKFPRTCIRLTCTITDNPLSVSHISLDGNAACTLHGIDDSVTTVTDGETVDVGPPQTQIWGTCDYS